MSLPRHLEPAMRDLLGSLRPRDLSDIQKARASHAEQVRQWHGRRVADPRVTITDHLVPGDPAVRLRAYRPTAAGPAIALPCLLWIHGGGHVMGEVHQDDPLLEHLAASVGISAFSVDWHPAPEHPFPAELEEGFAALSWVEDESGTLGVDPERVAVGGASSGGGTAAGLALLARDRGGPAIAFQLLVYPMLDDRTRSPAPAWLAGTGLWDETSNRRAWAAFLSGVHPVPAYAAPARAADLSGLPSAFIAVGDLDLLAGEGLRYGAGLIAAGVPTEVHVYPGGVHGFDSFVPDGELARRFGQDRDRALAAALRCPKD